MIHWSLGLALFIIGVVIGAFLMAIVAGNHYDEK